MNKLILGHNSFFGINHLDAKKGRERFCEFADNNKKIDFIEKAYKQNVQSFMMSTVDGADEFIKELNKREFSKNLGLNILLPYINKYVRQSNEFGLLGLLKKILKKNTTFVNLKIGLDLATFIINSDYKKIISSLIDIELSIFKKNKLDTIILHDALTDIIVAIKRLDILEFFYNYIKKKYSCTPGFATKNLPNFLNFIQGNFKDIKILTHVNKIGFNMNPNINLAEEALKKNNRTIICMSVLASGCLSPEEASKYLNTLNIRKEVVFGCSTEDHLKSFVKYFNPN